MRTWTLVTAGDLEDALMEYIPKFGNPNTPETWEKFLRWMENKGTAQFIANTTDDVTPGWVAGSLRDENINAHVMRLEDNIDEQNFGK